jgi:hypothetical protein
LQDPVKDQESGDEVQCGRARIERILDCPHQAGVRHVEVDLVEERLQRSQVLVDEIFDADLTAFHA